MRTLYNIIQLPVLFFLLPLLVVVGGVRRKYRGRILRRLGMGLVRAATERSGPRLWVHALSVGEAASVRPLLEAVRRQMPEAVVLFSTTTRGGAEFARGAMEDLVDQFVPFPFDLLWVVRRFVRVLEPDLFLLVETDFWPNVLGELRRRGVPCLLVNGRITERSFRRYRRFAFLFRPLFRSFGRISMQMEEDVRRLVELGVEPERLVACGNLKYDLEEPAGGQAPAGLEGLGGRRLLVAGSTHAGEERLLLAAFSRLIT